MSGTLAADGGALSLTGANVTYVVIAAVIALVALVFAAALTRAVLAAGKGTTNMQEISGAVQEGASAYLLRQFRTLAIFVVIAVVLLFLLPVHDTDGNETLVKLGRSAFFVVGALFSAFIGGAGMWLATRANLRVAAAAREREGGREGAMKIAFRTGGVVGFLTVGLGLFGAALVVLIYRGDAPTVLEGFGFGAALLAMFMRVGGGIFTKAADVGADLVGKVEQGIPEDDPRNAATIADNVGDNVGDCAGMAADLFESYAVTLVAALILGRAAFGETGLVFPLIISTIGVLVAIVGVFITRLRASDRNGLTAINRAFYLSALIAAVLVAIAAFAYLPATFAELEGGLTDVDRNPRLVAIGAVVIGIVLAAAIQALTGYFTETNRRPVQDIGKSSQTGAGHRHPRRHQRRPGVGRLLGAADRRRRVRRVPARRQLDHAVAVRRRAGRHRPAHHRRRHRRDGHVRPDLRQRAGRGRDVRRHRRARRADAHRAGRGRQHHQGDHQGHRDRHRRAGRDRAVRLVHRHAALARTSDAGVERRRQRDPQLAQRRQPAQPGRPASSAPRWSSSSPAWPSTRCPARPAPW